MTVDLTLVPRRDWIRDATCARYGPGLHEPDSYAVTNAPQIAEAKAMCATCPVRIPCLAEAIHLDDQDTIRGGLTPDERNELAVSRQKRKPGPEPKPCGTYAAYLRHQRSGETPCDPCRAARAEHFARKKEQP